MLRSRAHVVFRLLLRYDCGTSRRLCISLSSFSTALSSIRTIGQTSQLISPPSSSHDGASSPAATSGTQLGGEPWKVQAALPGRAGHLVPIAGGPAGPPGQPAGKVGSAPPGVLPSGQT